jgi:hypothetical protein
VYLTEGRGSERFFRKIGEYFVAGLTQLLGDNILRSLAAETWDVVLEGF